MNADVTTKKSQMKIGFDNLSTHHSKRLSIVLSRFDMDNFPVRVRPLQLAQTNPSKISSQIIPLEQPETAMPAARENEAD
jgi:hypothetical protein